MSAKMQRIFSAISRTLNILPFRRSHQKELLPKAGEAHSIPTPESLANVLVRRFEATLFVVPMASYGAGREHAPAFLRATSNVLSSLGGFEARRKLLGLFADLIEQPSARTMEELFKYIHDPQNADLRNALEWGGKASDALTVFKSFQSLAHKAARLPISPPKPNKHSRWWHKAQERQPKRKRSTRKSRHNFKGASFSPAELELAKEWRILNDVLDDLKCQPSSTASLSGKKWLDQCNLRLNRLRYLAFLSDMTFELAKMLVSGSR